MKLSELIRLAQSYTYRDGVTVTLESEAGSVIVRRFGIETVRVWWRAEADVKNGFAVNCDSHEEALSGLLLWAESEGL